jgi:hypothetical protein
MISFNSVDLTANNTYKFIMGWVWSLATSKSYNWILQAIDLDLNKLWIFHSNIIYFIFFLMLQSHKNVRNINNNSYPSAYLASN